MAEINDNNQHLIGDSGVITNVKIKQTTVFIVFCRILTIVLAALGIVALIVGNM